MITRTYSELRRIETFVERFDYLQLRGSVGEVTFGSERWLNQQFYRSTEWRRIRQHVIARDLGFDLGAEDSIIRGHPVIHHINPIQVSDFDDNPESLIDPEFLISTSHRTHNAIHYGDKESLPRPFVERTPGDTKLW